MDGITLADTASRVQPQDLSGFFVGWPDAPSNERRLEIVEAADMVVVAYQGDRLVGFITALTDGVFAASIPLIEVLPDLQASGVGRRLLERMLERLQDCYMIDLACDDDVVGFYERNGALRLNAMVWRNYGRLHPTAASQ